MASTNLDAVSVEIKVAGKVCDYVTMELFQSVSTHHRFKIKVNYRPDKPSVWAIGPDVIFKQLGEKVSIIMTHHESGEKTEFHGLISDIHVEGFRDLSFWKGEALPSCLTETLLWTAM